MTLMEDLIRLCVYLQSAVWLRTSPLLTCVYTHTPFWNKTQRDQNACSICTSCERVCTSPVHWSCGLCRFSRSPSLGGSPADGPLQPGLSQHPLCVGSPPARGSWCALTAPCSPEPLQLPSEPKHNTRRGWRLALQYSWMQTCASASFYFSLPKLKDSGKVKLLRIIIGQHGVSTKQVR